MTTNPFSEYLPTDRVYTAGDFAVTKYGFKSGWVSLNKFSSQEMTMQLALTYRLYDYQCIHFYQHYNKYKGTAKRFQLPQTFKGVFYEWTGTDINTAENRRRTFKRQPYWHYAVPIEQETIANGVSTLKISLTQADYDLSTTPAWARLDE